MYEVVGYAFSKQASKQASNKWVCISSCQIIFSSKFTGISEAYSAHF